MDFSQACPMAGSLDFIGGLLMSAMSQFRLELLNRSHDGAWNELVRDSPQGNAFMRSDFLDMLGETSLVGMQIEKLGVIGRNDKLVAGWAIPFIDSWIGRRSFGFGLRYSGPLLSSELSGSAKIMSRNESLRLLSGYARTHFDSVFAECHPSLQDVREFIYDGLRVAPNYWHVWDLTDPEEALKNTEREKRREIRRGLETYAYRQVRITPESFDSFIRLYTQTMQERHGISLGDGWVRELQSRLLWMQENDDCRLYCGYSPQGEMVSGLLVLLSREDRTAYFWMVGYDHRSKDSRIVPALYWHVAAEVCRPESGMQLVNLGTSPARSLGNFKDLLGARSKPSFCLINDNMPYKTRLFEGLQRCKAAAAAIVRRGLRG